MLDVTRPLDRVATSGTQNWKTLVVKEYGGGYVLVLKGVGDIFTKIQENAK